MHPGLVKLRCLAALHDAHRRLPRQPRERRLGPRARRPAGGLPGGDPRRLHPLPRRLPPTPWFRDEFAAFAIRHRAPIVPFVTLGTAETFPIVGRIDWEWWKRQTLWPYLPITTPLPLPAKWHTRILPPVAVDRWSPAHADDPLQVDALAAEVRAQLAAALDDLLARRRFRFFGGSPRRHRDHATGLDVGGRVSPLPTTFRDS